jgi:ribose transport system permease protein
MKKEFGIFVLLVGLCVFMAITDPNFLKPYNMQNMAQRIGMYGIFSIGLGIVIITGGIDLSVGSVFAILGVLLSILLAKMHVHWMIAVPAVLLVAILIGCFHGFLIAKVGLQPFIVTLCGLMFYRGVARYIAGDMSTGFGIETYGYLKPMLIGKFYSVPMPFILLVVISVIMWFVLHKSVYGRYLYAVGRNEMAAKYSGINSKLVIASAYVLCALLAGISGIILSLDTNTISAADFGNAYELYGIAAAVLGGCSLRGGEGSIIGIVIGTALLRLLENIVNLSGIPSSLNFAVMGVVILIGVLVDELLKKRSKARTAARGLAVLPSPVKPAA